MRLRLLAVVLAVTACSGGAPAFARFTGTVAGSDAVIGAVVQDGHAAVYVCGGASTFGTMSRWYEATLGNDGEFMTGKDGWGIYVLFTPGAPTVTGSLHTPQGADLTFSVAVATSGADGLYEAFDSGCRTGVVVTGSKVQGTWCDSLGHFAQVTPVKVADVLPAGFAVTFDAPAGARQMQVLPSVISNE